MIKTLWHLLIIVLLTILTQLGGLAWAGSLLFRRRVLAFIPIYALLSVSSLWVAPLMGREPLPCASGNALGMQSRVYCVLNRQYVTPELKTVLTDLSTHMTRAHPGTLTQVLDAGFPYFDGFPLLPHLSHDDGRKADLAFYYQDSEGYLPGAVRSPIGYFAFEQGPTECPDETLTRRWNLGWLQGLWPSHTIEPIRTAAALRWLSTDQRVGKVFLEPHLQRSLGVSHSKIRFQGCLAARHDDHIHLQL